MRLTSYVGLLKEAERTLAAAFRQVADGHRAEPDVHFLCMRLAQQCARHEQALTPIAEQYDAADDMTDDEPERLYAGGLDETRSGPVGLLRDLQDLYLLANFVDCTWTMIKQAGQALRDEELFGIVAACDTETSVQVAWLKTRMKQAAPQALVAAR